MRSAESPESGILLAARGQERACIIIEIWNDVSTLICRRGKACILLSFSTWSIVPVVRQSPVLHIKEFPYLLLCLLICQYICKQVYPGRYHPESEGNFVPSMLVLSLMVSICQ